VGSALVALALVARWRHHSTSVVVLGALGVLLVLAGLVTPMALRQVEAAWMSMAKVISRITTPVFMGVVYFVILTPIAFLRRTLGGNVLVHREDPNAGGFWVDRSNTSRTALDRQF
jgi:hypothetical protein